MAHHKLQKIKSRFSNWPFGKLPDFCCKSRRGWKIIEEKCLISLLRTKHSIS